MPRPRQWEQDRKLLMRTTPPSDIIPPSGDSASGVDGESSTPSSLGIHARFVSTTDADKAHAEALKLRFSRQGTARDLLPEWRVCQCLRFPTGGLVEVIHNPEFARASYGGLVVCGSVHTCPVCASKIGERRSKEIEQAATTWLDRSGGVLMATFTLQHSASDSLESVTGALNAAYKSMREGAVWQLFEKRIGLVGSITAREYTHGENGWHPHLHALLFCKGGLSRKELREANRFLASRWGNKLEKQGRYAHPLYSVKVQISKDGGLAEYIAKAGRGWTVGDELAKSNSKKARGKGQNIVQLLDAAPFDRHAARLFQEYAQATFNNHSLHWTPGLRKLLDMAIEKTDEQVAKEQEKGGRVLVVFQRAEWVVILANDLRAEVLMTADAGDVEKVKRFVARFGIKLQDWQLEPTFEEN